MPTIKLAEPWTYRTPLVTRPFKRGTHEVSDEIAAAAPQPEEEQETPDGDRTTAPRAPRRSRKAQD